jgi:hypothetical protein
VAIKPQTGVVGRNGYFLPPLSMLYYINMPQSHEGYTELRDQKLQIDMSTKHSKVKTPPHRRKVVGKPVATSTKQITRYITTTGIQSEISYQEKNWPEATIKELMTNAWDALNDFYPVPSYSKEDRSITVIAKIDRIPNNESTRLLRITVRNSNVDTDLRVFEDLNLIFDFDTWQSTKRNQHRVTGGALGDFLKRVLGMGYASLTEGGDNYYNFDSDSDADSDNFVDKQWKEPLILRFNGQ